MAAQTDFRPQLHGFDFDNRWDLDDAHRNFIRQEIGDAVPIAVKAIVTNPGIGAALIGAFGAAIGVGEALLPGLFDAVVIPILIKQLVNFVNDKIDNGLEDNYGLCGGMVFAPLDYYNQQWIIPKGVYNRLIGSEKIPFIVPPLDDPNAVVLRNYINQRFIDTWSLGGVRDKMVEWYVILKTIPSKLGGGGPEVQRRCKNEWVTLAGLLDQGKPQPLALLFDTWNIFDEHQVVAYGYGGDPALGAAFINIYDNSNPDREILINFDFTQSEMQGTITDVSGNIVTNAAGNHMYDSLKGFFVSIYSPVTPPPSWALTQGLTALPFICQSAHQPFSLSLTAANSFNSCLNPPQRTLVIALASDLLNLQVIPAAYLTLSGKDAYGVTASSESGAVSFNNSGNFMFFSKLYVQVWDAVAGKTAVDQFGAPLACFRNLPALNTNTRQSIQLNVLPRLQIQPVNRTGDSCLFPYVEGGNVTLMNHIPPFPNAKVSYRWQAPTVATGESDQPYFELFDLPAAKTSVPVELTITNLDTGCVATGTLVITPDTADNAARTTAFCHLRHILSQIIVPGLINPFGPDDPELNRYVQANLPQIAKGAAQIVKIADHIATLNRDINE